MGAGEESIEQYPWGGGEGEDDVLARPVDADEE